MPRAITGARDNHALRRTTSPAIAPNGNTCRTADNLIASAGMPNTTDVASSCAMVYGSRLPHLQHALGAVVAHARHDHPNVVSPSIARGRAGRGHPPMDDAGTPAARPFTST